MASAASGQQLSLEAVKALSYEIDAAARLMQKSLQLLREFKHISLDSDPLFACMAIGVEKVTKLTVGLASIEDTGAWPSKAAMQKTYGHRVAYLDTSCRDYMHAHVDRAPARPYMQRLLDGVAADSRLTLVMETLERYAVNGRFYNLDALAEVVQADPPPRELWEAVERSVWEKDPAILMTLATPEFEQSVKKINNAIAESIRAWWELYYRAWIQGVIGSLGKQWSAQLAPI